MHKEDEKPPHDEKGRGETSKLNFTWKHNFSLSKEIFLIFPYGWVRSAEPPTNQPPPWLMFSFGVQLGMLRRMAISYLFKRYLESTSDIKFTNSRI